MDQILTNILIWLGLLVANKPQLTGIQLIQIFVALMGLYQIAKGLLGIVKFLRCKFKKPPFLKGSKYLYHFTMSKGSEALQFREIKLKFKMNLRGNIDILATDLNNILKYKGYVKNENGQPLLMFETEKINYQGNTEKQEIQIRFFSFDQLSNKIACGLWMGNDMANSPICGIRILSSSPLSESQVRSIIKEHTETNLGMMRITDDECLLCRKYEDLKFKEENLNKEKLNEEKVVDLLAGGYFNQT